jgi:hypothetical protein
MRKNILAAIAATIVSASVLSSTCFTANASTADGTTDPNFVPHFEEEVEYDLAPPICILPNDEIPAQAWDDVRDALDQNDDNEIRVADAIQAKKDGKEALSKVICEYIINDGYNDYVTMSPVPLQYITDTIRADEFQLVSVWRADSNNDGESDRVRFMFLNTTSGGLFVYETSFVSEEQGFTTLWDYDQDGEVTEKDAATLYLNEEDEQQALAISSYAQFGNAGLAAESHICVSLADEIEKQLANGANLVAAENTDYGIKLYEQGTIIELRYW